MNQQPHDNWAEVYDKVYAKQFGVLYLQLTTATLEHIQRLTPKHGSIVDFGAGTG